MHLSGQTPLFRARNLEKYLNIEKIYLKLEGSNPTGHKNDRIAEAMVKYLKSQGIYKALICGSREYLISMCYFANLYSIEVYTPTSEDKSLKNLKNVNINIVKIKSPKFNDIQDETNFYEEYARNQEMIFLSEWKEKLFIESLAIQQMMEESLNKLKGITNVWIKATNGFTLKCIYHELIRNWVKGNVETYPKFHCGIKELITSNKDNSEDIFMQTNATKYEITKEEAVEATKLIKKLENITISSKEAYSLAALIKNKDEVSSGVHLIFLNDGKSNIDIKEISKDENIDIDEIVSNTRKLLEPYNDSYEETRDAVIKAKNLGFIFKAIRKDEVQGMCIVVHMGFKEFIPTYHLAYIGVKEGNSGRGVATELINEAIEKTNGNLSLHVDLPNKRAKKLYEKMGFVHCYDRMIYKSQE